MGNMRNGFRLSTLAAALMTIYGPALAQDEVDEEVAALTNPDSFVSIGAGNWSKDRPQQGIYDGMRESGVYGLIDGEIIKRDDATGTWWIFQGRNLGLDTREVRGEYLQQGNMGAFIEYSRTPREHPLQINTGVTGIDTTTQRVPTPSITPGTGSDLQLGTHRDATTIGFYKNLMKGLDFKVSFKNEDKNGTRHWGRGGAAEFAVEPIDSTTRQLEALLEYTGERLQLSGGYYGSWYRTENTLVDTALTSGGSQFFLSLPLNNEAHQAFLNGGYSFTPTLRGTFKLAYTHATQDEDLPTQGIPGLSLAGSPTRLDGELNTTLAEFGLTARPLSNLSVLANLRYHDLDDKTPVKRFVQTNAACGASQCVDNTPWSYETLSGKVEGTYRLPLGYSVTAGVEQRDQDRTVPVSNANGANGADTQRVVPFRSELEETTYRLQARKAMSETVNGSIAFLHSERDGDEFSIAGAGPGGAPSDLINPIHIADRDRDKVRLSLDWTPLTALSLQFVAEHAKDDYGHDESRPYGVREGNAALYSLDVSYNVSSNWQVNAWYAHDKTEAQQFNQRAANGGAAQAELEANLEEVGDAVGIGVRGRPASRLNVGADLQWILTEAKYPQSITTAGTVFPSSGTVTVAPLPDIENKLLRLGLFVEYAVQKNADVRVDFVHERWRTDDWSWMFADGSPFVYGTPTGTTTTDGTTVAVVPKSVSNFVGVRYIYRFQ